VIGIFKIIFETFVGELALAVVTAFAIIFIGQQRGMRILLQIGTLPLPLYVIGSVTTWSTAKIVVYINPQISIDFYAYWIAWMVGIGVFCYTLLWFYRIKEWINEVAPPNAAIEMEDEKD